MKLRLLTLMAGLTLALAGSAAAAYGPTTQRATTVRVTAKDFSFALSTRSVPHGRITFVIRNAGHTVHDFAIGGRHSSKIGPGKTTRLTVTLNRGRYPYRCTVDSHATLGMKGVLRVT
ncbi:MAG TPA: cupredoxin domain-containing protein [Gaiellaceae bacterium]|nr:cupredoxin domain-containing protein [Gaiellaceae bacterium]